MQRILITGGEGFLGANLAIKHLELGDSVTVMDTRRQDRLDKYSSNENLKRVEGDVTKLNDVAPLIAESDLVYHFASVVGIDDYLSQPQRVLDTTIFGARNVFSTCLEKDIPVVFSSTSEVYGDNPHPLHEEEQRVLGPTRFTRWTYSSSKAVAEHYAYAMQKDGLRFIILRYFNVYGPGLDSPGAGRVVSKFIGQFQKGEPLKLINGGEAIRSFCYISDAMDATVALTKSDAWGEVVNIGTQDAVTMKVLGEKMNALAKKPVPLEDVDGEIGFGKGFQEIQHRIPVTLKIQKLIGFKPKVSLEEGLRLTLDYYGLAK